MTPGLVEASPVLDTTAHVFDFVPLVIEYGVVWNTDLAIGFRGDAGFDLAFCQGVSKPVGMVIPPFLTGPIRRIYAASFSFCAGVVPPMPMLGRSLL